MKARSVLSVSSFFRSWGREISTGVLSGIIMVLSFPPYPTRVFAVFALVPIFSYFLSGPAEKPLKRGFVTCYIFGTVFFAVLLHWIANVIPDSNVTARWVLAPGVSLLVLYLALYPGLFGLLLAYLIKRFGRGAVIAAPGLFPLAEMLRSSGELGFSWGTFSGTLVKYPLAVQGLSVYGSYGFSFMLVLVNLLIAVIIFSKSKKWRLISGILFIVIAGSHIIFGLQRVEDYRKFTERINKKNIAVVQPNVGLDIKWEPEYKKRIFREIDELTVQTASHGADLVIFPETSAPISISRSPGYRGWLQRIARRSGVELLVGFIDHMTEDGEVNSYNGAGLFDEEGRLVSRYHKINLLPFGEKIPFSPFFPALENIRFGQANFRSGRRKTIFRSDAGRFGVLICFESTFADQSRNYVRRGAEFLVNITNDGWFNGQRGPIQHSETAILRAVENGVFMLRSANTGVSMFIDPAGRVVEKRGLNEEGIIYCGVEKPPQPTIYNRYGNTIFYILASLSIAAALLHGLILTAGQGS